MSSSDVSNKDRSDNDQWSKKTKSIVRSYNWWYPKREHFHIWWHILTGTNPSFFDRNGRQRIIIEDDFLYLHGDVISVNRSLRTWNRTLDHTCQSLSYDINNQINEILVRKNLTCWRIFVTVSDTIGYRISILLFWCVFHYHHDYACDLCTRYQTYCLS